ncbi:MAG: ATP-binding cassette domain-containing protein [Lachnospiraceae bacterium]|nr:ATP-binding cassette domain-containing protein [Lachnospiraceae bacterium]
MALFSIKNLTFTYPDQGPTEHYSAQPALRDLSFDVEEGEFLVICGKSGCGKTTLLRHFKTALSPYGRREGEVLFRGEPLAEVGQRRQAASIGYVLQSPDNQLVTDKVWHELAFGLENLGTPQEVIRLRVAEMASFFGIEGWFDRDVEELSGGQKQLLNLASVMAMQPEVLVLDEPTSQLDPIAAGDFLSTLHKINRELGTAVVLIEHRLEEVFPMADRVLVLEEGRLPCLDTPARTGKLLAGRDLFAAMPAPMQIYEGCGGPGVCPLTVREGRRWLREVCDEAVREDGEPPREVCASSDRSASGRSAADQAGVRRGKRAAESARTPLIEAKEVWFRYEKELPDVIRDLSLMVYPGETFCLLGGNGAGKSTLLSLLSGIHRPTRGKIRLEGKTLDSFRKNGLFDGFLGVLPQNPQCLFVADTVEDDLSEMLSERKDLSREEKRERIRQVAERTQIGHLLKSHPYDLSGGEQQRAALAKVLLLEPRLILLDEPTKGLDGFYKRTLAEIFQELKEAGATIFLVSHDIEFCASYGDRCGMMFDGNIVTARPAREFFRGNSFYTTAANRMARDIFPDAVTAEDVVTAYRALQRGGEDGTHEE